MSTLKGIYQTGPTKKPFNIKKGAERQYICVFHSSFPPPFHWPVMPNLSHWVSTPPSPLRDRNHLWKYNAVVQTVFDSTVLYCTLYSTVLYCTLYCTVLFSVLCTLYSDLYYIAIGNVLHCTALCTALHCINTPGHHSHNVTRLPDLLHWRAVFIVVYWRDV